MANEFSGKYSTFQERCGHFGGIVLRLMKEFPAGHTKTIVADQLSCSATSIGANASEARSAESRADFIHKMQMALKEAREAYHWLTIVRNCGETSIEPIVDLLAECDELIAIMVASVNTAKLNRKMNQLK